MSKEGKIDYTYVHNRTCALWGYVKNWLVKSTEEQQKAIFGELKQAMEEVAFNEAGEIAPPKNDGPYVERAHVKVERHYNPDYGDDRVCKCGHTYYRHFDSWEDMRAIGCKYCDCYTFEELPNDEEPQEVVNQGTQFLHELANDKERLQQMADEMAREMNERKNFINTSRFADLFNIIQERKHIDEEHLRYQTQIVDGLTAEDFCKVHDTIFLNFEDEEKQDNSDPNCNFPHTYIDYKGIRFHLMVGQGSALWSTQIEGTGTDGFYTNEIIRDGL